MGDENTDRQQPQGEHPGGEIAQCGDGEGQQDDIGDCVAFAPLSFEFVKRIKQQVCRKQDEKNGGIGFPYRAPGNLIH